MKSVAVHSGRFHADDVFSVAVLRILFPNIEIIRTREEEVFNKADLRVDVGLKNNPKTGDFDHHQKEGAGLRENNVPYASFGLIWKEFGNQVTQDQEITDKIDRKLVQFVDAMDNGYKTFEENDYTVYQVIVELFNPFWNEESDADQEFIKAVELAKSILLREIQSAKSKIAARSIVRDAINKSDGKIIILEKYCPWKSIVTEESDALFIVFPASIKGWIVHAVPVEKGTFENRKTLPKKWMGKTGSELQEVTGIKTAEFCHRAGFIAGANTKEDALLMAKLALDD